MKYINSLKRKEKLFAGTNTHINTACTHHAVRNTTNPPEIVVFYQV